MLAGVRCGYELRHLLSLGSKEAVFLFFPFFAVSSQASVLGQRVAVMLLPHSAGRDGVPYCQQANVKADGTFRYNSHGTKPLSKFVRLCRCIYMCMFTESGREI